MKKHTPEEIVTKLRRVEKLTAEGLTVADAVREIGVTMVTYYRWKKTYGNMDRNQAKRLREIDKENARLKKLLAEAILDNDMLRGAWRGENSRPGTVQGCRLSSPARVWCERAAGLPCAGPIPLRASLPVKETGSRPGSCGTIA